MKQLAAGVWRLKQFPLRFAAELPS